MHDSWWDDYKVVPSSVEEYFAAMGLLQVFDRLNIVEVRPCYRGDPHNEMSIWVDDVYYIESLEHFVCRFRKLPLKPIKNII